MTAFIFGLDASFIISVGIRRWSMKFGFDLGLLDDEEEGNDDDVDDDDCDCNVRSDRLFDSFDVAVFKHMMLPD